MTTLGLFSLRFLILKTAIAEKPRDALCQVKSCQLLHNYANKKLSYRRETRATLCIS